MGPVLLRAVDEVGVKVPRVHHNPVGARIGHQDADLFVVGFGLGERVVQDDVDGVFDVHRRVEFGDDDAVTVWSNMFATPLTTTS